jgi:hypothetical protein
MRDWNWDYITLCSAGEVWVDFTFTTDEFG